MGSRPSPFMDTFTDMLPMVGSRRRVKWGPDPPLLWIHLQTCYPWLDLEGGQWVSRPSPFMDTFTDMLPMVGSRRRVKGVNGVQTLPFYGYIYRHVTHG